MSLSSELISQLVKVTNDSVETKKESTVYGTTVEYDDKIYVKIDGSDQLTPVSNTSKLGPGERVIVMIKNHTATVTGNLTSPSARWVTDESGNTTVEGVDVDGIIDEISRFEIIIAYRVTADDIAAINARIDTLKATVAKLTNVEAVNADIETLRAKMAELTHVSASDMEVINADIENLRTKFGDFTHISTEDLEAVNADINSLKAYVGDFTYVSAEVLTAMKAVIKSLETEKLSAAEANLKYANIDFSNIGRAAMEYFYSASGLIENVVVGDGTITGDLVGVTIKGDIIEGSTVVADKLVIQGEDGLYYKLNTDGVTIEGEQTEYNSLNGSIITAKSITATQISVDDLVAFDATLGGFNITANAIYSGVKESMDNSTSGVYLDREGQFALGDGDNFLRYFKDDDGNWRLEISAESILFGADSKSSAADIKALTEHVKIGTYEDPDSGETRPCVELSEGDSDFKQVITNTSTMFMDGAQVRTQIDPEGVTSDNITVNDELRQGNFVWVTRSNGNLALVWKGEDK